MKALVAPSSFGECGSEPLDRLRASGLEVVINPFGRPLTPDELLKLASDCQGLIAGIEPLTEATLRRLPKLRCISRCGSGLENVDVDAARRLGTVVLHTPDAPARAVAEFAIALILSLLRDIPRADRNVRTGLWRKCFGGLVFGRRVGVIGLGRIGKLVTELVQGLGGRVVGTEPRPDVAWLRSRQVPLVPLHELLANSDVVSLHLAHRGPHPILGAPEIRVMSRGAFLVNTSRGSAVDQSALYDALNDGHLAGAALDVFESEPYRGRLVELENVILTPHIGSYAREARLAMETEAVDNLLSVLASEQE